MKHNQPYISFSQCIHILIGMLIALVYGCAHEEVAEAISETKVTEQNEETYLKLHLSVSTAPILRAYPTGGEEGDAEEKGQDYENAVYTARLYLFKQQEGGTHGVNRADSTVEADAILDFNAFRQNGTTYESTVQKTTLALGTYDAVVLVNGEEEDWEGIKTLGNLQAHIRNGNAWRVSPYPGGYAYFTMASSDDATATIAYSTEDNPCIAEVNVERHAARVDYKVLNEYTIDDQYTIENKYTIAPNTETQKETTVVNPYGGAKVEILGATLVNNLMKGCYTLKRVAENMTGPFEYLGKETPDKGINTNYVIDPWSQYKDKSDNALLPSDLYGRTLAYSEDASEWAELIKEGTPVKDNDGVEWMRVGYTLENTMAKEYTDKRYATAIVFKAKFYPAGLTGYEEGSTFFSRGTTLYAHIGQMMEESGIVIAEVNAALEACATWDDVKEVLDNLKDGDPVRYKVWLQEQYEAAVDQGTELTGIKESLKWDSFMKETYGYEQVEAEGKVTVKVDVGGKNTRKLLDAYRVRVYKDAICYYMWWIRHSNDDNDDVNGLMEFAIVRNNIYKLNVEGIYTLGSTIPEEENIRIRVYVKNWSVMATEELELLPQDVN